MNKSFIIIIIIFLRESVTYSFTCMYREVFLNIYFKGEITFACVYYCLRLSLFEYLKYIYQRNYSRKENIATICRPCVIFNYVVFFVCFFFFVFFCFFLSLYLIQIRTFFFSPPPINLLLKLEVLETVWCKYCCSSPQRVFCTTCENQ